MAVQGGKRLGRERGWHEASVCLAGVARRSRRALLLSTALQATTVLVLALPARAQPAPNAQPTGGVVVAGSASISQTPTTTTINQASQRAALNWQSFNVGSKQSVDFHQPNASAVALNRVLGPNPSQIAGRITANGQVILENQDGITFYKGAQINTAGFVATAAGITNKNFMAGHMVFDQPAAPNARVVNEGRITVRQAGLAALVAPQVANSGVITARLGRVVLAGAVTHTLDLYGDGLVSIDVNGEVRRVPVGPDGKPVTALVTNTGTMIAAGGEVELTAQAADGIVQNLVDAGGRIAAPSVGAKTGVVVLNGIGGSITVAGQLDASGNGAGQTGGTVAVTGHDVRLASSARVDVSGDVGGGTALVGGNFHGAGPEQNAQTTTIAAGASIRADALTKGNGGRVAVWSDTLTRFDGAISARGGPKGGNGGFVETSGKRSLAVHTGSVTTDAPDGTIGEWLLDPASILVSTGGLASLSDVASFGANPGTTQYIDPSTIDSAASNVTLQATNWVEFEAPIAMTHDRVGITAQSGDSIVVDPVGLITTRGGNITLIANDPGGPSSGNGYIYLQAPLSTNGGGITGGNVTLQGNGGLGGVSFSSSAGGITTAGGSITVSGPESAIIPGGLTFDTTNGGLYSSGANITFTSTLTDVFSGEDQRLTLTAGSGDIYFGGNVQANGLTIGSARNVTSANYIAASAFTDTNQIGNLTIPGGIWTSGIDGARMPGTENAGPITISTDGNITVGTSANSRITANGGYQAATGDGGNGADVSIWAGGVVTLSGISTNGGIPHNGSSQGGNAGNISITGSTISLLGYPLATFSGVPNLTLIALNAVGGPSSDTTAFLPQNIGGVGGNITLTGHVVLRGGFGTKVVLSNASNGPAKDLIINGSVDATTAGAESLELSGGHGQITAGNIGANVPLGNVQIFNNKTGSFGSVSSATLSRYYTPISFNYIFGPSTTTFSGPVEVSGNADLTGVNLIFAGPLSIGGAAGIGSANLSATSVSVGGPTTILGDTTINTSAYGGPIRLASINGYTPDGQSLTLDSGTVGSISHGVVGASVPLRQFTEMPAPTVTQPPPPPAPSPPSPAPQTTPQTQYPLALAGNLPPNPTQEFGMAGSTPPTVNLPKTNPLPASLLGPSPTVDFPLLGSGSGAGYHVNADFLAHGGGPVSDPTKYFPGDLHLGVDLKAHAGDAVFAPVSGSIVYYHTMGNGVPYRDNPEQTFIVLRGDDGRDYVLGHVDCTVCNGDGVRDAIPFPRDQVIVGIKQGQKIGTVLKLIVNGENVSHLHFGINTGKIVDSSGKLESPFINGQWGDTHYTAGNPASLQKAMGRAEKDGWVNPVEQKFVFSQ